MNKRTLVTVVLMCGFVFSGNALAVQFEGGVVGGSNASVPSHVAYLPSGSGTSSDYTYAGTQISTLGSFDIVINAGATLASNAAALAAFNRAAAQWESRISDPITINIDADLGDLGSSSIIGQSATTVLVSGYDSIRNDVVADAGDEADDQIVSHLPTYSQFSASLPTDFSLDGNLMVSKANLKALGATGLGSGADATITFNTAFSFDYDNSDGVTGGTMDFETVAAHELGHALGFISSVDEIDQTLDAGQTTTIAPTTLDLFRFDNNGAGDPATTNDFTNFSRSLIPGNDEITDQILTSWGTLSDAEFRMATGYYEGDGRQASHWKDNLGIGIMDPTLTYGEVVAISEADFRALDLIGYEIAPVPEPGTLVLLSIAMTLFIWRRRRRS